MATVLLTLDGSTFAEQAIPHALGRLGPGDELVLLMVIEPAPSLKAPDLLFTEVDVTGSQDYLQKMARRLADRSLKVRSELRIGSAREEIIASAIREGASLIVIASHGRTGLARWLLGSVAESVARQAPCPVWLVRCQPRPAFTLDEPWDEPPRATNRLLVPLDTSESHHDAVDFVRAQFRPAGLTLVLMSATNIAWLGQTDVCLDLLADIRTGLETQAESLRRDGWSVEVALDPGAPAEAILDMATDWQIDLIVLASHRRTTPQRWFLGSVTEKVVRHAHCPVAVVRVTPAEAEAATKGAASRVTAS